MRLTDKIATQHLNIPRLTRVVVRFPIRLCFESEDGRSYHTAWAINWSSIGTRIGSHAPLEPGQILELAGDGFDGSATTIIRGWVTWAGPPQTDGSREFGIEFYLSKISLNLRVQGQHKYSPFIRPTSRNQISSNAGNGYFPVVGAESPRPGAPALSCRMRGRPAAPTPNFTCIQTAAI